jgi:hypothetical protein
MRRLCLFLAIGILSGCFAPAYREGQTRCSQGTNHCPDGYYCGPDGACWLLGDNRDFGVPCRDSDACLNMTSPFARGSWAGGSSVGVTSDSHRASITVGEPMAGTAGDANRAIRFGMLRQAMSK